MPVAHPLESRPPVAVYVETQVDAIHAAAKRLADRLSLPLVTEPDPACALLLTVTDKRLELRSNTAHGPGPVYVDFVGGSLGHSRRVNRFGLLFRAIGAPRDGDSVVDATAGLGHDAFLLAYHGWKVTAIERSPILAALLADGIERAQQVPEIDDRLRDRLELVVGDAREVLKTLTAERTVDVVYVDPMFPPKKKSALVKKEMRVLRRLVGDDPDAGELLDVARSVAGRRVVVKRMIHAPPIAPEPSRSYRGKTARYDVYERRKA